MPPANAPAPLYERIDDTSYSEEPATFAEYLKVVKMKFSVSYGVRSQLRETFHFSVYELYIFRYTE